MLSVSSIKKSFGARDLFKDVTFTLGKKERCALLGRNGSGKSTLLSIIAGRASSDGGEIIAPKGYTIGHLRQHLSFSQPTIRGELLTLSSDVQPHEADALLCGLGFNVDDLEKSPGSFSGGYQLRVELAKTLITKPDLLLLDEPTNYLDIVSIRFLERLLKRWDGEAIIISHDRSFLDAVCTHVIGLHRGSARKVPGGTEAYFRRILEDEETKRRESENIKKQKAHLEKFVERFRAKASKAAQAQSKMKAIEKLDQIADLEDEVTLSFSFTEKEHPGKCIADVKNISFSYEEPLLKDISFAIHKGEKVAIIGKNGCGKSTLLRLLAGEISPQRGHIKYSMNAEIGYFGQTNVMRLDPEKTIHRSIGDANSRLKELEIRNIAAQLLFRKEETTKQIKVLSGGEKARVLLARIVASACNLLLLDEPTNHLDIESVEALLEAITAFKGGTVIVTHNEWVLRTLPLDKIIVCGEGEQRLHLGSYDEFLQSGGWGDAKEEVKEKKPQVKVKKDLAPLRAKIRETEKKITQLETSKQRIEKELSKASEEGNIPHITKLSIELHSAENELIAHYQTLEELYGEESAIS